MDYAFVIKPYLWWRATCSVRPKIIKRKDQNHKCFHSNVPAQKYPSILMCTLWIGKGLLCSSYDEIELLKLIPFSW